MVTFEVGARIFWVTSILRRWLQAGQDEHETLETLFRNIDLSFAKTALCTCNHCGSPGRPPRNPIGLFRTFIVMRMKAVRSLREMTRILDTDQRLDDHAKSNQGESVYKKRPQQVHPQNRRKPPHHNNRRDSCQAPETEPDRERWLRVWRFLHQGVERREIYSIIREAVQTKMPGWEGQADPSV